MTSPVITIHCPRCGASVKDAPYGGRINCRYCDTELHIPDLHGEDEGDDPLARETDDAAPSPAPRVVVAREVEAAAAERPPEQPGVLAAVVLFFLVAGLLVYGVVLSTGSKDQADASRDGPTAAQKDNVEQQDKAVQRTKQRLRCNKACERRCPSTKVADQSILTSSDCLLKCWKNCRKKHSAF